MKKSGEGEQAATEAGKCYNSGHNEMCVSRIQKNDIKTMNGKCE